MPNRMLRDWTDSDKVHNLSAEAERFFTRLIMKADDFGRYYGNVKLLKSNLFPLYDKLKDEKISAWLQECIDADLVFLYEVDSKKFIEIKMFDQKLKVRRSKYPPSDDVDRLALREGYVYIIGTSYQSPVKVGFSINPWSRLKEITTNHHEKLEILLTIKGDKTLESEIHRTIKNCRVKNEWFNLSPEIVDLLIQHSKLEISRVDLIKSLRSLSSLLRSSPEIEREEEVEYEEEGEGESAHTDLTEKIDFTKNKKKEYSSPGAEILYTIEHCITVAMADDRWVKDNKASPEILALFNAYLSGQGIYDKNPADYKKHFYHWLKKEKNGSHQQSNGQPAGSKPGTSAARTQALKNW